MSEIDETTVQCARCGRNGEPPAECEDCNGKAATEPREYTLSEVRAGKAPQDDRYGLHGAVGPKIVNFPGSGGLGGS